MDDLVKVEKDIQEKINKLVEDRDRIDKVLIKFGYNGSTVTEGKRPGRRKAGRVEPAQGVSDPK